MAIPEQIDARTVDDYLEVMTKAVFQAGVSWAMVENKWPAFRKVFAGFSARDIAQFTDADIERLSNDASILRSRNKIAGTIKNAQTMVALEDEHGDFRKYLRSKLDYKALSKDLQKRFKYMGEMNCYYFLFRVKEPVPEFEAWIETIEGHHPRMREMVELGLKKNSQAAAVEELA
jgi:3-methyladenine DNA glycosylase Tag